MYIYLCRNPPNWWKRTGPGSSLSFWTHFWTGSWSWSGIFAPSFGSSSTYCRAKLYHSGFVIQEYIFFARIINMGPNSYLYFFYIRECWRNVCVLLVNSLLCVQHGLTVDLTNPKSKDDVSLFLSDYLCLPWRIIFKERMSKSLPAAWMHKVNLSRQNGDILLY